MTEEKDRLLVEMYPKMFTNRDKSIVESPLAFGFEHEDGWYQLLDTLCHFLQFQTDNNHYPQVIADQVKEKFGVLNFYYHTEEIEHPNPRRNDGFLDGAIEFAQSMSAHICEICGLPGETRSFHGWLQTLCPTHTKEREERKG